MMKIIKIISRNKDDTKREVIGEYKKKRGTFHIHKHGETWKFFDGWIGDPRNKNPILETVES